MLQGHAILCPSPLAEHASTQANEDEAEQSDWHAQLPAGLEVPQQSMRVGCQCSSSLDTWEQANPILFNVCLVALRDRNVLGALFLTRQ